MPTARKMSIQTLSTNITSFLAQEPLLPSGPRAALILQSSGVDTLILGERKESATTRYPTRMQMVLPTSVGELWSRPSGPIREK